MLSTLCSIAYLVYRGLYTLNLDGLWPSFFSIAVLIAEIHGISLMLLYYWQIQDTTPAPSLPPLPGKTVDIFLPTYNEDVQLLRGSVLSYLAFDYPCKIYVLDDGNRAEVRALAEELGVEYIARGNNLHAKAGNINHALEMTSGEFVVIFDADHVARPHFISRTLGYFADERVGWVQTPHAFYNFDSFSSIYQPERSRYWEEGDLFYRCIQLGKSNANAVVFCGSAAMMRRSALEDVGLIAVETITEDMHTGLRMHAKGWKSVFVEERLIAAQAANDVTTYQSQRLRWGEGNLSIIRYDNPLTMRGLTLTQRIHYIGSMLGWSSGVGRLVLYATPILMLLTGVAPVRQLTPVYVALLLSHLIVSWTTLKLTGMGAFRIIGNELTGMACFWVQMRAVWRALTRKNSRFVVTKKRGRQTASLMSHIVPQLILLASGLLAIAWSAARVFFGVDQNAFGLAIGTGLIIPQTLLAWTVIRRSLCGTDRRFSYRHQQGAVHVVLRESDSAEPEGVRHGVCCDFNETGARILCFHQFAPGAKLKLTLETGNRAAEVDGIVRWAAPAVPLENGSARQGWHLGIQFEAPSEKSLKDLWTIGIEHFVVDSFDRFHGSDSGERDLLLPVVIKSHDGTTVQRTLIRSFEGTTLFLRGGDRIPADSTVCFEIHSPLGMIRGCGKRELPTKHDTALRVTEFSGQGRGQLKVLQELSGHERASALVKPVPRAQRRRVRTPLVTTLRWVSSTALAGCAVFALMFSDHLRLTRLLWFPDSQAGTNQYLAETCDRVRDGRITDLSRITLLVRVLEATGRTEDLSEIFQIASKMQPENEGLLRGAVNAIANSDGPAAALQFAEDSGLRMEQCETETLMTMVRLFAAAGTPARSAATLEELVMRDSLTGTERVELAGHCLAANLPSLARKCLEGVTVADDPATLGLIRLMVAVAEKDVDVVRQESHDLVRRFPSNAELLLQVADCLYWSAEYSEAIAIWSRKNVRDHLPDSSFEHFADSQLKLGNAEQAMQLCLSATGPVTALRCAVLLEAETAIATPGEDAQSDDATAGIALNAALRFADPDERLIWAVVQHFRSRDQAPLLTYLETHRSELGGNPDLLLELADLYFARQEFERVIPLLARVRQTPDEGLVSKERRERIKFLDARTLAGLGQYSEAAEILKSVHETRSMDSALTAEIAGLLLSSGRTAESLELSQSISLQDCSLEVAKQVVGLQSAAQAWPILRATLSSLSARFPNEPELCFASAEAAFATQEFDAGLLALQSLNSVSLSDELMTRRQLLEGCGRIWNGQYPEGLKQLMPLMDVLQEPDRRIAEDTILLAAIEMESIPESTTQWGLPVARSLLTLPPDDRRLPTVCAFLMRNGAAEDVVDRLRIAAASGRLPLELRMALIDALAQTSRFEAALREIHSVFETEDLEREGISIASPYTPVRSPSVPEVVRTSSRKKNLAARPRLLLTGARCAANCGRLEEAVEYFEQLRDEGVLDESTKMEFAGILFQLDRSAEAASLISSVQAVSGPEQILAFDILLANGRTEDAKSALDGLLSQSGRSDISSLAVEERKARLAIVQKDYVRAAVIFDELIQAAPAEVNYVRQAAGCSLLGGDYEKSLLYFGTLLQKRQLTDEDSNGLMAAMLQAETLPVWGNQWADQLEIRVLRGDAVSPDTIEQLVYIRQKQKNLRSAMNLLKCLIKVPGRATPRIRFLLANIAAECGDFKESERQLDSLRSRGDSEQRDAPEQTQNVPVNTTRVQQNGAFR